MESDAKTQARPTTSGFSGYDEAFSAYENGKHRRYELLFAVNGGAFALAKLAPDLGKSGPAKPFVGELSVDEVALGMIAFTIIMFVDIAAFGRGMRRWEYNNHRGSRSWSLWRQIFSLIGLIVLFSLCTLICGGWYLVQDTLRFHAVALDALLVFFVLCVFWYLLLEVSMKSAPR